MGLSACAGRPADLPENLPIRNELIVRVLIEGAILALVLIVFTHLLRRYAGPILFAVLLVAALAYVGFALRADAGAGWVITELIGVLIYSLIGWMGLRGSLWWLAAGWALHPIWDIGLHYLGPGRSFVHPLRYPIPCVSFDLLVAAYVAYLASVRSPSRARFSAEDFRE